MHITLPFSHILVQQVILYAHFISPFSRTLEQIAHRLLRNVLIDLTKPPPMAQNIPSNIHHWSPSSMEPRGTPVKTSKMTKTKFLH
jgi:exoribonuclease R